MVGKAKAFAERVYELISFLVDVRGMESVDADFQGRVTYHDSCSGLRELGIKDQPRRLLASVRGLELAEMADAEVCCGFGGTFAVKYPDISNAMVEKKTANVAATDRSVARRRSGCLLNMAKAGREGRIAVRHVAKCLPGKFPIRRSPGQVRSTPWPCLQDLVRAADDRRTPDAGKRIAR